MDRHTYRERKTRTEIDQLIKIANEAVGGRTERYPEAASGNCGDSGKTRWI